MVEDQILGTYHSMASAEGRTQRGSRRRPNWSRTIGSNGNAAWCLFAAMSTERDE